jgi:hypothetical protein
MSEALKFSPLDADSREFLENDDDARRGYLDLLTYLHERVFAVVNGRAITPLDANHVDYGLGELKYLFRTSLQIGRAARHNITAANSLAELLQREPATTSRGRKPSEIERSARTYLNAVLNEYDSIRIISCKQRVS